MDRTRAPVAMVGVGVSILMMLATSYATAGPGSLVEPERVAGVPDQFASYSYLTGSVSSSPPGRAIALYQHGFGVEFLDFEQAVMTGADDDAYRRVDLAENRAGPETQGDPAPMRLSPDGTRIAVGDYDAAPPDIAVLDLATSAPRNP